MAEDDVPNYFLVDGVEVVNVWIVRDINTGTELARWPIATLGLASDLLNGMRRSRRRRRQRHRRRRRRSPSTSEDDQPRRRRRTDSTPPAASYSAPLSSPELLEDHPRSPSPPRRPPTPTWSPSHPPGASAGQWDSSVDSDWTPPVNNDWAGQGASSSVDSDWSPPVNDDWAPSPELARPPPPSPELARPPPPTPEMSPGVSTTGPIPRWGIQVAAARMDSCAVCLEEDRMSNYICCQCRRRPACLECSAVLVQMNQCCPLCRRRLSRYAARGRGLRPPPPRQPSPPRPGRPDFMEPLTGNQRPPLSDRTEFAGRGVGRGRGRPLRE
ncbi:serine/arginine repetitive matrix protein 1-like [Saccostrea echinata]|uniref:serine/arginine repetitive matrix protein 1-like n=1 Tax=Saccostrea echinata TaxID=191078 RepID=UPI002A82BC81|nr:serine/arginine repetitive matrix protein 1-like [Saccostrea echinata]